MGPITGVNPVTSVGFGCATAGRPLRSSPRCSGDAWRGRRCARGVVLSPSCRYCPCSRRRGRLLSHPNVRFGWTADIRPYCGVLPPSRWSFRPPSGLEAAFYLGTCISIVGQQSPQPHGSIISEVDQHPHHSVFVKPERMATAPLQKGKATKGGEAIIEALAESLR